MGYMIEENQSVSLLKSRVEIIKIGHQIIDLKKIKFVFFRIQKISDVVIKLKIVNN